MAIGSLPLRLALPAACILSLAPSTLAQVVNPADKQKPPPEADPDAAPDRRMRTFELPPTLVEGMQLSSLREEDRIGSYGQPRWTATRLFPTTRVYVVPEGKVEFEYWTRAKTPRHGPTTVETQYEIEFGLPHRFMLDLYWVGEKTGAEGERDQSAQKTELRYALADWGKIWANPTLYAEYVSIDSEPDVIESKLLLGDELAVGWHWGSNLVWERQIGGSLTNVFELTGGLSHTIIDEKFSLGGEFKVEFENAHADRDDYTETLEVGPSFQWRPMPGFHMDLAPLIGIGHDSRQSDIYFVLGYEF